MTKLASNEQLAKFYLAYIEESKVLKNISFDFDYKKHVIVKEKHSNDGITSSVKLAKVSLSLLFGMNDKEIISFIADLLKKRKEQGLKTIVLLSEQEKEAKRMHEDQMKLQRDRENVEKAMRRAFNNGSLPSNVLFK